MRDSYYITSEQQRKFRLKEILRNNRFGRTIIALLCLLLPSLPWRIPHPMEKIPEGSEEQTLCIIIWLRSITKSQVHAKDRMDVF